MGSNGMGPGVGVGRLPWAPQAQPPHINTPETSGQGRAALCEGPGGQGWVGGPPHLLSLQRVPSVCLSAFGLSSLVSYHSLGCLPPTLTPSPDTVHIPYPKLNQAAEAPRA